jgi:hypothetical protein
LRWRGVKSEEQLLADLGRATDGLLFMSESDYPFQTFRWEGLAEVTPDHLREAAGRGPEAPVEARGFDDFFGVSAGGQGWKGPAEVAAAGQYGALVRLMKENLEDLSVYRVGEINVTVFVVGRSRAGNWVGVSTQAVET